MLSRAVYPGTKMSTLSWTEHFLLIAAQSCVFSGQCTFWAACLSECLLIYFPCWRVVSSNSKFYCIALGSLASVWGDLNYPLWSPQWFCTSRVSFTWNKPVCLLVNNIVASVLLAVDNVDMPLWSGSWTSSSDILFSWNAPGPGVCLPWTVVYSGVSEKQLLVPNHGNEDCILIFFISLKFLRL